MTGTHVLVALDGSATAEMVLPWAALLAEKLDLPLHLTTVLHVAVGLSELELAARERAARHYLIGVAATLPEGGITAGHSIRVTTADIAQGISAEAEEIDAAVIVIGTHGYSGFDRWMLGSVADAVVRTATRPVLLVRADPAAPPLPPAPVARIMVPLDGFGLAEAAIEPARWLARAFDAIIDLVHVIPGVWAAVGALSHTIERQLTEAASVYLQRCAAETAARPGVETHILRGSPAGALLDYQDECGAALIVMSTHGHGGVMRWALGSVADRIARTSACPVLLVRPEHVAESKQPLF